jgi:hypothetical protein
MFFVKAHTSSFPSFQHPTPNTCHPASVIRHFSSIPSHSYILVFFHSRILHSRILAFNHPFPCPHAYSNNIKTEHFSFFKVAEEH